MCGSPNCRGYIGGDLTSSDVIAQDDSDDEYGEPVMVCEDGEMKEDWKEIMSNTLSNEENKISSESPENICSVKKNTSAVGDRIADSHTSEDPHVAEELNTNKITVEPSKGFMPAAALKVETEGLQSKMHLSSQLMDNSDGVLNKTEFIKSPSKSLPEIVEHKRKLKYAKSSLVAKTSRSLSSIKKGKPKMKVLNDKASPAVDKLSATTLHKSKKLPEVSLNSQVEAGMQKSTMLRV